MIQWRITKMTRGVGELGTQRMVEGTGFVQPRQEKAWGGGIEVFQYLNSSYTANGGTLTRTYGDIQEEMDIISIRRNSTQIKKKNKKSSL